MLSAVDCSGCPCSTHAGATGLVGSRLSAKLAAQGNKVRVLTRNVNSAKGKLQYPGLEFYTLNQITEAVTGADAVVNLAGTPIGTRCDCRFVGRLGAACCVRLGSYGRIMWYVRIGCGYRTGNGMAGKQRAMQS